WPMWAPDGRTLYFVSEMFGTPANIVRQELDVRTGTVIGPPQQITSHKEDGVRKARLSANGETLVYECGAGLYLASAKRGQPRKLAIDCNAAYRTSSERVATFTSGATEFAMSPDEKHVAIVVHGDIFLLPRTGGKAKRLTDHPAFDHGIAWAPDGKKMLFLSDRGGQEDIYLLEPDDPEHPEFAKPTRFTTTPLTTP